MTDATPTPKATPARGFFYALLCDEAGVPDEANVAFLVSLVALIVGAFLDGFGVGRFPLAEFGGAVCALIPLYRATRGDMRG